MLKLKMKAAEASTAQSTCKPIEVQLPTVSQRLVASVIRETILHLESKFKDEYVPTTGARVYSKTIKADDGSVVRMAVWDVPGHRAFTEARTEYYKETSGLVYVFDVTKPETFTNLPRWVNETSRYAPRAKAIVVGNKTDLVDERRVSKKDGEGYALKLGAPYFEVSSKNRENTENAFTAMAGLIVRISEHTPSQGVRVSAR